METESDKPQSYWGVWQDETPYEFARFLSDAMGRYIFYPSPAIAQAHADELNATNPARKHTAKEYALDLDA